VVSIHATGTYKEICETGTTTSCVSAGVTGGTGTVTCKTDCSAWNTVPTGCSTATAASKALSVCQKAWTCPTKPYWNNEFDTSYYNVDAYAQYWVGTGTWDPANDTTTQYSATPRSTSCQFTCGYNLTWDSGLGICVGITNPTPFNCANYFTPGTGKVLNTPSTYTQTWSYSGSGWGWSPADDTTVDYSSAYVGPTNPCTYRCNTGYTHYNGTCYPDSKHIHVRQNRLIQSGGIQVEVILRTIVEAVIIHLRQPQRHIMTSQIQRPVFTNVIRDTKIMAGYHAISGLAVTEF
jgi:hypothetical protein